MQSEHKHEIIESLRSEAQAARTLAAGLADRQSIADLERYAFDLEVEATSLENDQALSSKDESVHRVLLLNSSEASPVQ